VKITTAVVICVGRLLGGVAPSAGDANCCGNEGLELTPTATACC